MGNSKIVFGDRTLIDLTEDTVTPEAMLAGVTAHNAAGDPIEGTLVPGNMKTSVYDPKGKAQDIFAYADAQAGAAMDAANAAGRTASTAKSTAQYAMTTADDALSTAERAADDAISANQDANRALQMASAKLDKTGDGSNVTSGISYPSFRSNLQAGEKLSTMFGKIYRYFADLGSLAFKSKVAKADLAADVPLLPDVTAADNGKFLRVVNGAWAAATVDNANGGAF